jgi:NADPH:quinone reductase-like Zn-dependent oxidoreductase
MSVFDAVGSGTLKLRIEHVYQLNDAAQAHRDLYARSTSGKLLIAFDHAQ